MTARFVFYAEPGPVVGDSEARRLSFGLGSSAGIELSYLCIEDSCDFASILLDRSELQRVVDVLTETLHDMGEGGDGA